MFRSSMPARTVLTAIGVLLSVGCGEKEEVIPDTFESPTPSQSFGEPFKADGTFAGKFVISQSVENVLTIFNPDDFEKQIVTTYSVVKLRSGSSDTEVLFAEDNCLTEMTEVAGALSTLDQGFYTNSPVNEVAVTLSDSVIGSSFVLPETVDLKGVTLANPATDPLPTDKTDSRIYDFDGDGNPGFTVHVTGSATGDLYAIERYIYSYSGTIITNDLIGGLIAGYPEDVFVESTSPLIPTDTEVKHESPAEENFFQLVRVADNMTCEQVIAQKATLFP